MQVELTTQEPAKTPGHGRRTGLGWSGTFEGSARDIGKDHWRQVGMPMVMLTACLALAGCKDIDQSRAENERKLPPGCRIIDLDYRDLQAAVVCDGRVTTTTTRHWSTQSGKMRTSHTALVAVIE